MNNKSAAISSKSLLLSSVVLVVIAGAAVGVYLLDQDIFFGIFWFLILNSTLSHVQYRFPTSSQRLMLYCVFIISASIWVLTNQSIIRLAANHLNSNPYGDYMISDFTARVSLSVFVLKMLLKCWLNDVRLVIVALLVLANVLTFPRLKKWLISQLSHRWFEFVFAGVHRIKLKLYTYLGHSFALAVLSALMWGLAALLLKFDNVLVMTIVMALSAFIPHIGLFVGAGLSLLFVESGLYLLQFGGLLIAFASIWFVVQTLFVSSLPESNLLQYIMMMSLLVLGYIGASFTGLFSLPPLIYIYSVFYTSFRQNFKLVHSVSRS